MFMCLMCVELILPLQWILQSYNNCDILMDDYHGTKLKYHPSLHYSM